MYTHVDVCGCVATWTRITTEWHVVCTGNSIAVSIFRLLHRNFESVNRKMYHPLVCTPRAKLDFIGLLSILRSQKVLPVEAITADLPASRIAPKFVSDRSGAVCTEKQSRSADSFRCRLILFSASLYFNVSLYILLTVEKKMFRHFYSTCRKRLSG